MASKIVGVSLRPESLKQLDKMAARAGESRSSMIASLVERATQRSDIPDVRVDGRRFVPEKR